MGANNNSPAPLASAMGMIHVIKNGEDGIGILSANVLFTTSNSSIDPPSDDVTWADTFAGLEFAIGRYLWSCTEVIYSNKDRKLTGKYCVGACKDLATVLELYQLGDSNVTPPTGNWSESYTPVQGKWLWTKNQLTFNNGKVAYTDPRCIGHFSKDGTNGTSFTLKGKAYAHYELASKVPSVNVNLIGRRFLVDKMDTTIPPVNSPCVAIWKKIATSESYILSNTKAEVGDAYVIDTTLWVANDSAWVEAGSIQGPSGEAGEDALWVMLSPDTITFESDKNGSVAKGVTKTIAIRVYKGKEIVTRDCTIKPTTYNDGHYDIAYATFDDGADNDTKVLSINSSGIGTKTIESKSVAFPVSMMYLSISYGKYKSYLATIKILVDASAVDGYFRTSIDGLDAKYTKMETITNDHTSKLMVHEANIQANAEQINQRVSKDTYDADLNKVQSNISDVKQTAENIKVSVKANEDKIAEVDLKADNISSRVTDTETNLKSEITQTASGISAKVKDLSDGVAATGINIEKKSITMTADKFTLKNNNEEPVFSADKDGNGIFKGTIEANAGKIAGLKIAGNSLINDGFDNNSYIIFRNDNNNQFVGIGHVGVAGDSEILGRFENNKKGEISNNVALILSATNANRNFAFVGNGNGFLNGYISGYAYQTINANKDNTVFIIEPKESMLFFVYPTKESASVGLPIHQDVASMLGIGQNDNFVVPIEIVLSKSKTFIYGRTTEVKGMDSDNYPVVGYDQKKKINEAFSEGWIDNYFRSGYNKFLLSYIDGTYIAISVQTTLYSNITYNNNNE